MLVRTRPAIARPSRIVNKRSGFGNKETTSVIYDTVFSYSDGTTLIASRAGCAKQRVRWNALIVPLGFDKRD